MSGTDVLQILFFFVVLTAVMPFLGDYMAKVYSSERTWLHPVLEPLEKGLYLIGGVKADQEMNWKRYALALLWFNLFGMLIVLGLQLLQKSLPLNPQSFGPVELGVAVNTAVSFMSNTNWQAYSGEAAMSYLTQMLGLNVQNFLSAATGMAVLVALIRGLVRKQTDKLGNFWVDMTRSTVFILLPLSLILALALVSQGAIQNLTPYTTVTTLEGAEQVLPLGPASSQIAIKQLGTNGGGFFGVNSAHPYENPTPLSNVLQMLSILLIPCALTWTYGRMVGSMKQGMTILAAMMVIFAGCLSVASWAEFQPNQTLVLTQALEGKETRFGIVNSVIWGVSTTMASNGSVNAMHDSFSPLAGGITIFNMMLGEVVFGGVGAGLYGILMFVLLTVFIAGLMVGRTPEYLGKKIEAFDIRLAALAIVLPCSVVLILTAIGVSFPFGTASISNPGPHGLSEVLYAFTSMSNNNGSAFGGLNATAPFYTWTGALAMLLGRFGVILPALAIAGNLASKKAAPPSAGTFPTDGGMFVVLLISVVLIVGALTFFPVLSLGPIVEHLLLQQGQVF